MAITKHRFSGWTMCQRLSPRDRGGVGWWDNLRGFSFNSAASGSRPACRCTCQGVFFGMGAVHRRDGHEDYAARACSSVPASCGGRLN